MVQEHMDLHCLQSIRPYILQKLIFCFQVQYEILVALDEAIHAFKNRLLAFDQIIENHRDRKIYGDHDCH